jgi:hypothetical protein
VKFKVAKAALNRGSKMAADQERPREIEAYLSFALAEKRVNAHLSGLLMVRRPGLEPGTC